MIGVTARYGGLARWASRRRRALIGGAALAAGIVVIVAALGPRRGKEVRLAYVASAGNNHIQVIDLASGRTLRKIYTGATPWRLVAAPDRKSLWVQHWYAGTTAVVSLENHEVRGTFASRGPGAFSPSGAEFLSFDWPSSMLRRFDAKTLEPLGQETTEVRNVYEVVPDPQGRRLLLAQYDPMVTGPHQRYGYILAYTPGEAGHDRAPPPTSIPTGQGTVRVRVLAGGEFFLTADHETNGLTLINKLGDRRSVPTCAAPQELVISPDEKRLIVACAPALGSAKGRLVSYRTDFRARPWPTIAEEAAVELVGSFASASFAPSGDRVYLADKTRARLVELEPATLKMKRELPTGDVPLDIVILDVPERVRDRLAREEGRARSRLRAILTAMKEGSSPLVDLSWIETVQPMQSDSPAQPGSVQPRRVGHSFRAPSSVRAETEDGGVRLAQGGHSVTISPDGRFWVGPRQDLRPALISLWSLSVDDAIRELAGDVPGSPFLRNGLAVDLIGEARDESIRNVVIGTLRPSERVSQLWLDTKTRRPTKLAEAFPIFAVSAHGSAGGGGYVETKFYDFVRTAGGAELPTRLERLVDGRQTQTVRIEALKENSGLAAGQFDLARLGSRVENRAANTGATPAPEKSDATSPGQAVAIASARYLSRPGEPHPDYNSNPPTSGPRLYDLAAFRPHRVPIPPEIQVHNLEHGAVLIQYNCPEPCADLAATLESIADSRPFVVTAPYPLMTARIALTAWGRIDSLDELDVARIDRFIAAHAGKDHHAAGPSLSTLAH
jgi:uncharacterized protein DUF3105